MHINIHTFDKGDGRQDFMGRSRVLWEAHRERYISNHFFEEIRFVQKDVDGSISAVKLPSARNFGKKKNGKKQQMRSTVIRSLKSAVSTKTSIIPTALRENDIVAIVMEAIERYASNKKENTLNEVIECQYRLVLPYLASS